MTVAAELLWQLVPPLTYACDRFVISAVLEPCYEVGGDGFDYEVGGSTAYLSILDTAGHGLPAGLGTAVALAGYPGRPARPAGFVGDGPRRRRGVRRGVRRALFTTGVLVELDLDNGLLRYVNAGHPPPLVLRGFKVVGCLNRAARLPLGIDDPGTEAGEMVLQPGDRLLCYTDGVTEATDSNGEVFGEQRLVDLAERHATAGLPAPETLRRLSHALLAHLDGPPADDATLLLMEWSHTAAERVMP